MSAFELASSTKRPVQPKRQRKRRRQRGIIGS